MKAHQLIGAGSVLRGPLWTGGPDTDFQDRVFFSEIDVIDVFSDPYYHLVIQGVGSVRATTQRMVVNIYVSEDGSTDIRPVGVIR